MPTRKLALAAAVLAATSAHAQYGMEQMMNPMTMMNPAMMMNPMSMMMPMTMMMAPMSMGMMNPMTMMAPMGMMSAPMMGGMASPQQYMTNPYLSPMGTANPYLMQQQPQAYYPMMPAAPAAAPAYGAPAYGYYPQAAAPVAAPAYGVPAYGYYPQPVTPQAAPAGTWDPSAWMQMFGAPVQPAPQR